MLLDPGIKRSVIAVLTGCLLGGCAVRVGDFTVASTKNIGQLSLKGDKVEGEDCANNLLGLIPISGPMMPNLKTAVDRALERAKGDVLADAVVSESLIVTIIFNQHCYKAEGTVARAQLGSK